MIFSILALMLMGSAGRIGIEAGFGGMLWLWSGQRRAGLRDLNVGDEADDDDPGQSFCRHDVSQNLAKARH